MVRAGFEPATKYCVCTWTQLVWAALTARLPNQYLHWVSMVIPMCQGYIATTGISTSVGTALTNPISRQVSLSPLASPHSRTRSVGRFPSKMDEDGMDRSEVEK
ncbi:hypothetical protein CROQUDRAFT_94152 [Cronartium quercuum f. sp. fusiforme G11]|uniref:Uncharacterized protein n=1 Tax=Cronartium quercuum f. sp. fusiforme G11 TaxID=708437 RepID=A0A9P6TAG8_9BASI|nr:hypothetical protein CROQUDRAFT_94152 [Cronartium quercuum f. sp. fusiforme G11]